jgi:RHS repeat-associated protein
MSRAAISTALFAAWTVSMAGAAYGQGLAFTRISYPASTSGTYVTGLNNNNVVVGYYQDSATGTFHGFSCQNGSYTLLDGPLSKQGTRALAINNAGQILVSQGTTAGAAAFEVDAYFIFDGTLFTPVGLKGIVAATGHAFTLSSITGFNDGGQVVGIYSGHGVYGTPALGAPGATTAPAAAGNFTQFDCPSSEGSLETVGGINVSATITGSCGGAKVAGTGTVAPIGFVYKGTLTTFFDPIPFTPATFTFQAYDTQGVGVNSSGLIAGAYQSTEPGVLELPFNGFLYDGSTFTSVLPPDGSGSIATGVSDSGTVVGYYVTTTAPFFYGFIAVPSNFSHPGKAIGACGCSTPGQPTVGASLATSSQPSNPNGQPSSGTPGGGGAITASNGNMFEQYTDYSTSGQNPLSFARYYNSQANTAPTATLATSLGMNWRSTYDRYLSIASATSVTAERADGQQLIFTLNNGTWTTDTDIDVTLTNAGAAWTLTDSDDTEESYMATSATEAQLRSIKFRNGYTQTLTPNGLGQLASVSDVYGRSLDFIYSANGLLQSVTTPDAATISYGYAVSGGKNVLASVTYSTTPASTIQYLYENAAVPFALTGIIDENGHGYATWTYDNGSRALTSQVGAGAGLTAVIYNADGSRTVTNALGVQDTYKFTSLQGVPKVTEIDRAATATTAAAKELFTYDVNGFTASQTDWVGNLTTHVNDTHGQPTTLKEATGSGAVRTTTIAYDSVWVHLPKEIVTAGLTMDFTYDGVSGELLTRKLTDTTITAKPYSTSGQTRTWTNTWSSSLLASTTTPNGNTTTLSYDGSGALVKTTNALNQSTGITAHTEGGLPLTIVDPNGVTANRTYDARQRILTNTINTSAGALTTRNSYDAAGDLIKTTLPDGSALTNSYDFAHRLIRITDLFGQEIAFTLDALGDRTAKVISGSRPAPGAPAPLLIRRPVPIAGRITNRHTATYDDLGRILRDIGGAGQTTAYTYDANGNALSVTDPLGHKTIQVFDALNRLTQSTDPNGGITAMTYDAHDRVLSVTDPNGNVTTYVYDGFGDLIQQTSPDTGVTVYRYDADGNLTQKTDASGNITNNSFDALDRPVTTSYPADATLNVGYVYDQTGHGFGIGRLTSLTDAAGTLSRSYDERGNRLIETRVNGATTLKTAYTYDPASRIASITYPSGWTVAQTRDAMGRITQLPLTAPAGASSGNALTSATYEPFGPLQNLAFGNGISESRRFDLAYRMTNLTDSGTHPVQNLTYAYDADDDVTSITDGVTAANTQSSLSYDALNRLTSAYSNNYGFLGWTYDGVGNRLTQSLYGTVNTTYAYAAGTNRLASITASGVTTPVSYTATGNIASIPPSTGAPVAALTYSAANRLNSVIGTSVAISSMKYDAFGKRISKADPSSNPVLYSYDQNGYLLEEADGNGLLIDYVYLNGRPVAEITGGSLYYLHVDRLGTPQLVTNGGQNVAWSTTYQPFGGTPIPVGSISQNLRFPGQYEDGETSLSYNLNRDYMPNFGRYVEADSIGRLGGPNLYLYATGNPQKFTDRFGETTLWDTLHNPAYWSQLYDQAGNVFAVASGLSKFLPFYAPELALPLAITAACFKVESVLMKSTLTNEAPNPAEEAVDLVMDWAFSETQGEVMWPAWQYWMSLFSDQPTMGPAPPLPAPPLPATSCGPDVNGVSHICITHPNNQ